MSKRWAQIGEQGVHLVIAELLARDIIPYRPVCDDHGVDLMLEDGTRLQVKASHLSPQWQRGKPSERNNYQFSLQKKISQTKMRKGGVSYEYRHVADDADYLVLVGLDERRFWIVPTSAVVGCTHIGIAQERFTPKTGPTFRFWRAIQDGEDKWDSLRPTVSADNPEFNAPTIYERDGDFVATLAVPVAA